MQKGIELDACNDAEVKFTEIVSQKKDSPSCYNIFQVSFIGK